MTTKNKIILSIVVFALLFILPIGFLIYSFFIDIKNDSEAITSQKANFTALDVKISNLLKFRNTYEEYKLNLEKIDTLFIDAEVPIEFISFLEKTSQDCQVETKINPSSAKQTEAGSWPYIIFQINTTGSFPSFSQFLEKLETSPYLVEIQNLSINKINKGQDVLTGDINANFAIKIYTNE